MHQGIHWGLVYLLCFSCLYSLFKDHGKIFFFHLFSMISNYSQTAVSQLCLLRCFRLLVVWDCCRLHKLLSYFVVLVSAQLPENAWSWINRLYNHSGTQKTTWLWEWVWNWATGTSAALHPKYFISCVNLAYLLEYH